jgi:hypothetical protein
VPKHVGAALVINTLTKLSAQCWFLCTTLPLLEQECFLKLKFFIRGDMYKYSFKHTVKYNLMFVPCTAGLRPYMCIAMSRITINIYGHNPVHSVGLYT